jgi:restriction endonuclease
MMVSKGITLLSNTVTFNDDIKQWRRKADKGKTWDEFKTHFQRAHQEWRKTLINKLSDKAGWWNGLLRINDRVLKIESTVLVELWKSFVRKNGKCQD